MDAAYCISCVNAFVPIEQVVRTGAGFVESASRNSTHLGIGAKIRSTEVHKIKSAAEIGQDENVRNEES